MDEFRNDPIWTMTTLEEIEDRINSLMDNYSPIDTSYDSRFLRWLDKEKPIVVRSAEGDRQLVIGRSSPKVVRVFADVEIYNSPREEASFVGFNIDWP